MAYHRLTRDDRYQIWAQKSNGSTLREIARLLKRAPSTISRELRRCDGKTYSAHLAHQDATANRIGIGPKPKIRDELKERVEGLLQLQWSPEQISGRLKKEHIKISHETIYKHVYANSKLSINLRRRRKHRRTRLQVKNFSRCGLRINQAWIEERPKIVDEKVRFGDFERDLILGKKSWLLTSIDRKSRRIRISRVEKNSSSVIHFATLKQLEGLTVHTITNDNGPEFALHHLTAKTLNANIYFARPYCSWQRGANENANGLIRQYFPKGTDFNQLTEKEIQEVEDRINNRPRKCLGYQTPNEVHTT